MKKKILQIALACFMGIAAITIFSSNKIKESNYRDGGGYGNLVDELYDKTVDKNAALQDIESSIKKYYDKKENAIKDFKKYDYYNTRFYTDAKTKLSDIKDSTSKEKAKKLIAASEASYIAKVTAFNNKISTLEKNEMLLTSVHELFKITITTPLIEKYQTEELPNINILQGVDTELKNIIEAMNKQIK
jgi:uncharacterized protein YjaG (DUF416 family)